MTKTPASHNASPPPTSASPPPVAVAGPSVPAPRFPVTALDVQRKQLEKLMKRPDQRIVLDKKVSTLKDELTPVQDFVSNVQGSSAGAGSGDFHVYRMHRRRELLRQKVMDEELAVDKAEAEHRAKVEAARKAEEEKTAKRRAKRLKRKASSSSQKKTVVKGKVDSAAADDGDASGDDDEASAVAEPPAKKACA
ncbi:hypothetical protein H9P43_003269 [Blastocladiella emersonii ATCC 22665]|nr:hypothetical protein H9P43_003269 [Blastocladiella emersonii ATCC 22665]